MSNLAFVRLIIPIVVFHSVFIGLLTGPGSTATSIVSLISVSSVVSSSCYSVGLVLERVEVLGSSFSSVIDFVELHGIHAAPSIR
jgi:hypothetical protein